MRRDDNMHHSWKVRMWPVQLGIEYEAEGQERKAREETGLG